MTDVHPIKKYRQDHGLSPEAAGDMLDVSRQTIHRWERGDRQVDVELLPVIRDRMGIHPRVLRPDLAKLFDEVGP